MKKKQNKCFDDYLKMSKHDSILYLAVLIIIIIIFFISMYILYNKMDAYMYGILILMLIEPTFSKIFAYTNNLIINRYLINHGLKFKLGNIIYWNKRNYFLTDNYMILINGKKVDHFNYQDIKQIHKIIKIYPIYFDNNKNNIIHGQKHLIIELENSKQYKILIYSSGLISKNLKDISEILLEKNPNIKVLEDKK